MPLYVTPPAGGGGAAPPSAKSAMFRPKPATDSYLIYGHGSTASITFGYKDYEKCFPVFVPQEATATELSIFLRGGQASTTIRLGWREDSEQGPGTLIVDLGTVDTSGANGLKTATGSWVVPAGVSWISATLQGGSADPSIDGAVNVPLAASAAQALHNAAWSDVNNYTIASRWYSGVSGALATLPTYANGDQGSGAVVPYFLVKFPI